MLLVKISSQHSEHCPSVLKSSNILLFLIYCCSIWSNFPSLSEVAYAQQLLEACKQRQLSHISQANPLHAHRNVASGWGAAVDNLAKKNMVLTSHMVLIFPVYNKTAASSGHTRMIHVSSMVTFMFFFCFVFCLFICLFVWFKAAVHGYHRHSHLWNA